MSVLGVLLLTDTVVRKSIGNRPIGYDCHQSLTEDSLITNGRETENLITTRTMFVAVGDPFRIQLFGHICRLSRDTPASQALHLSLTPSPAHRRTLTGSAHRAHKELGFNRWNKIWVYPGHQCLSVRNPGPFIMEIATTTVSWSSAAVSEYIEVSHLTPEIISLEFSSE